MKEKKHRILSAFCFLLLLITIILPADAEKIIETTRGNVSYVSFTVSANPDNAVAALLELQYDHSIFELWSDGVTDDRFIIANDLKVIPEGQTYNFFFKISNQCAAGDYPVSFKILEAYDAQERPVTSLILSDACFRVITCQADRDIARNLIPGFGMSRNQFRSNFEALTSTYEAWIHSTKQFKDFPYQLFMRLPIYPTIDYPSEAFDDYMGTLYQPLSFESDLMDYYYYTYYYNLETNVLSLENYWFEYPADNYILFIENEAIQISYKGYYVTFHKSYDNDNDIVVDIHGQDSKPELSAYYHYNKNLPYPDYSLFEIQIGNIHLTP